MRQSVKKYDRKPDGRAGLTCVIASHNLRELEDICDHVGLFAQRRCAPFQRSAGYEMQYPEGTVCVSDREQML